MNVYCCSFIISLLNSSLTCNTICVFYFRQQTRPCAKHPEHTVNFRERNACPRLKNWKLLTGIGVYTENVLSAHHLSLVLLRGNTSRSTRAASCVYFRTSRSGIPLVCLLSQVSVSWIIWFGRMQTVTKITNDVCLVFSFIIVFIQ